MTSEGSRQTLGGVYPEPMRFAQGKLREWAQGDRQYLQLSTDLSPFLLLDRKLHFGDVVARVHVLRMLEINLAG